MQQVESRDSSKMVRTPKESEISAMSSAYSRSDTDTYDISFFLVPTRSASKHTPEWLSVMASCITASKKRLKRVGASGYPSCEGG